MDIIRNLQEHVSPDIFTPKGVYDGRKNFFITRRLPFEGGRKTVGVVNRVD